jgi:hypothetical protein
MRPARRKLLLSRRTTSSIRGRIIRSIISTRLALAHRWGKETLKGGELNNKQLPGFFDPPDTAWSPRVLKDGSDSVGVVGALNRVYVNIGLYSEDWFTHFNPSFGGKPITPFLIKNGEENSAYWRATEAGTPFIAKFFLQAGQPDHLKDAPCGDKYLTADEATLKRGKNAFAETCAGVIRAGCQILPGRRLIREDAPAPTISNAGNAIGI